MKDAGLFSRHVGLRGREESCLVKVDKVFVFRAVGVKSNILS